MWYSPWRTSPFRACPPGRHSHNGEDKVGEKADQLDERQPELRFAERLNAEQLEGEECKLGSALITQVRLWERALETAMRKRRVYRYPELS